MLLWDDKLVQKCRKLGLIFDMYSRYVDDMILVMRAIGKGWKFDSEKGISIFDSTLELMDTRSPTERTANLIASIANTINSNIQVTVDTPECDSEGRIPVLDMKVWCDSRKILHTFYKKPVSSKFTILSRSAI